MRTRFVTSTFCVAAVIAHCVAALALPPLDIRGTNLTITGSIRLGGMVLGGDQNLSADFPATDSNNNIYLSIPFNIVADPAFPNDPTHIQVTSQIPSTPVSCNLDGRLNITLKGTYVPATGVFIVSGSKPGKLNIDTGILDDTQNGPLLKNGDEIWIQLKDTTINLHGTADVVGGKIVITGNPLTDFQPPKGGPGTNMTVSDPVYVAWLKPSKPCPAADASAQLGGPFDLSVAVTKPYAGFRWRATQNSISGKITLDSIPDLSMVAPNFKDATGNFTPIFNFELRPSGGGTPIEMTATLATGGSYILTNMPLGKYDVAIKGSKWLQSVVPGVEINGILTDSTATIKNSGQAVNVNATLLGGDADNSNTVDFDDLTILAIAYNTAFGDSSGLYDDRADFNCDGQVEFADLTILAINYNLSGNP